MVNLRDFNNLKEGDLVLLVNTTSEEADEDGLLIIGKFDGFIGGEESRASIYQLVVYKKLADIGGIRVPLGNFVALRAFPTEAEAVYVGKEEIQKAIEEDPRIKDYF